jgi:hypothetical protein
MLPGRGVRTALNKLRGSAWCEILRRRKLYSQGMPDNERDTDMADMELAGIAQQVLINTQVSDGYSQTPFNTTRIVPLVQYD